MVQLLFSRSKVRSLSSVPEMMVFFAKTRSLLNNQCFWFQVGDRRQEDLLREVAGRGQLQVAPRPHVSKAISVFPALKHMSRIFRHSSNPVSGFSMMEQVRLFAVWPMENWLGSSWNHMQGLTTVRESHSPALEQGPLSHIIQFSAFFLPLSTKRRISGNLFTGLNSPLPPEAAMKRDHATMAPPFLTSLYVNRWPEILRFADKGTKKVENCQDTKEWTRMESCHFSDNCQAVGAVRGKKVLTSMYIQAGESPPLCLQGFSV